LTKAFIVQEKTKIASFDLESTDQINQKRVEQTTYLKHAS
jgi:hypothetical protein